MQATISTINDNGIAQIAAFLRENHKKGEMIAESKDMLRAWAADAEFQLGEGNPASIDIKSWDSVAARKNSPCAMRALTASRSRLTSKG